eukprot:PITA_27024
MASATLTGKTTFCVTGATGFVASSLVQRLLHQGYTVHATVREPGNEGKVRHLLDIPGAGERLKIFRADLLEEGSFDAAIDGCDGVFHVASPVNLNPNDPERDIINPAISGTLNVLRGCSKAKTVKRVVVTSSACTASINKSEEQNQCIDETCWTDVDFLLTNKPPGWAYPVSKTLAERAALQYGNEQGLDVVTINPVLVAGSAINPNVPQTVEVVLSLLTGTPRDIEAFKVIQMVYGFASLVHVDDVCSAQIFLMDNPSAVGRHICCSVNSPIPQLAHYLSKRYPQYNVPAQFENVPPIQKANLSSKKLVDSGFSFKFGIDEIFDDAVDYLKTKGLLK